MTNQNMEQQLKEINQKLDFLTEQMAIYARRQREMQELKEDLGRIATDLFQSAVQELDEVSHHFDSRDLLHLLKKLLRNTRNLTKLIDRAEGLNNFFEDAAPIGKQAFLDLLTTLDELDKKGYFEFLKELTKVVDRVVTSFSVEDVKLLGENIVTILETVKTLTQPEMLVAVNNAVSVYKNLDINIEEDVSYWKLLKEARSQEAKRGFAFGLQFLKNLARPEILPQNNHKHLNSKKGE